MLDAYSYSCNLSLLFICDYYYVLERLNFLSFLELTLIVSFMILMNS